MLDIICALYIFLTTCSQDLITTSGSNASSSDQTSQSGIERYVIGPLKVWHIVGLSLTLVMTVVVIVCCWVDVRIPKPRHEIEQKYARRKLHDKYGERFFTITGLVLGNQKGEKSLVSGLKMTKNNLTTDTCDFKNTTAEDSTSAASQGRFGLYTGKGLNRIRPEHSAVIKTLSSLKPKAINIEETNT